MLRPCTSCAGSVVAGERDEERAHLARRENLARLDRRLARERRRETLVARGDARIAIAAQRIERLAQAARRVEARMRHRDAAHDERVPAEPLDLEAELREQLLMRLERLALGGPEMQRDRKEQPLRRRLALLERAHEALVQHALVRRVLVDEHDAALALEHEIHARELHERRHVGRRRHERRVGGGDEVARLRREQSLFDGRGRREDLDIDRLRRREGGRIRPRARTDARRARAAAERVAHGSARRRARHASDRESAPRPSSDARSRRRDRAGTTTSRQSVGRAPAGTVERYACSAARTMP